MYSNLLKHFENINEFEWIDITRDNIPFYIPKFIWIESGKAMYIEDLRDLKKNNRKFCTGNYEYICNKF